MSLSVRVTYKTAENSLGQSRLWFATSTKQDLRETFHRQRIRPENVILFEKKVDGVYQNVPLEKLRGILEEQ
ncbi:hypothetical protein [Ammoniphilus sp. YIM 78166]|uniref:hypothetical protein n=1 Tax=Ammoniphilus sp. YIM 78166 TaxID=1644106 RepID=UPI00106F193E|nr:hypothetical protein [Ammoniphilus sp. YIM 78166]